MRASCSHEVERLTGRTVIGFTSGDYIDRDIAVEVFILRPSNGVTPRITSVRPTVALGGGQVQPPPSDSGTMALNTAYAEQD